MKQIKILLVDDQTLFVESLRTVLETRAEDIQVVGVANDGDQAVELVAETKPDVVLMDVRMPIMNGVEATRIIKGNYPETRILMLTTFDDDQYVIDALRLGAAGYLLKDMPPAELISAIRAVNEGGILIAPKVATKLVNRLTSPIKQGPGKVGFETSDPLLTWVKDFSNRELIILQLLAQGLDNKEIAQKLFIAEQTVKNHVSVIYSKLGVHDRVQASRIVFESGFDKMKIENDN